MPNRAGITTRPDERKNEWQRYYPNLRDWQMVGPFASRAEAERWESNQLYCLRSGGGAEPEVPDVQWWGYTFRY